MLKPIAGYLEPEELENFNEDNFWLPMHWALSTANSARDEGVIKSDNALQDIFRVKVDRAWGSAFRREDRPLQSPFPRQGNILKRQVETRGRFLIFGGFSHGAKREKFGILDAFFRRE